MQLIREWREKCCHCAPGDTLSGEPVKSHIGFLTVIYISYPHPNASPSITWPKTYTQVQPDFKWIFYTALKLFKDIIKGEKKPVPECCTWWVMPVSTWNITILQGDWPEIITFYIKGLPFFLLWKTFLRKHCLQLIE